MRRMLDPKTIALIGASEAEGTVGRTIMENLLRSEGRALFPVNPNHKTVFDVPCFPSIGAVPEPVDLAVVATPAATVPDVLLECAKAGVHGAIVVSAGFGETGREGLAHRRERRQDVHQRAQGRGVRCGGQRAVAIRHVHLPARGRGPAAHDPAPPARRVPSASCDPPGALVALDEGTPTAPGRTGRENGAGWMKTFCGNTRGRI